MENKMLTKKDIDEIMELLHSLNDEVQSVHPDDDDETGSIVHNCCYTIAERLGRKW